MNVSFYEMLGVAAFVLTTTGIVVFVFFRTFNEFKEKFTQKIDDGFSKITDKDHRQDLQFRDMISECQTNSKDAMKQEFNEVWKDIEVIKKENITRDNEVIGINERYTQLVKKIDNLETEMKSISKQLNDLKNLIMKKLNV